MLLRKPLRSCEKIWSVQCIGSVLTKEAMERMAFLGFFRRKPPIRAIAELTDFIDQQSAYLIQKGIYDYSTARVGPYSKSLLAQQEFMLTMEASRWRAYPLGLAMVGEMVEGVLQPHAAGERRAVLDPLSALVLDIFDRYTVPATIRSDAWLESRRELALKLDQLSLHPPKRVIDIPEPYAERYFHMMPFDKELLTNDVPTTRSFLRLTLTNIRDELVKRMDAAAMAAALRGTARK